MNEKQTRKFIALWNKQNGFNMHEVGCMSYKEPGIVTWNEYDAPNLDILQVVTIYKLL